MSELVVISLGSGNFNDGFPVVTAHLGKPGNLCMKFIGSLPKAPEIPQLSRNWRLLYKALNQYGRSSPIEIASSGITHISDGAFTDICQRLEKSVNFWLSSDGFHNIELQLRTQLNTSQTVQIVIESDNGDVWRLPWHLWKFLKEDYHQAEVSLSTLEYPFPALRPPKPIRAKVKILAILGNSIGINLKKDQALLKKLPGVEIKFLNEPQRQELNDQLWEQGWDILFFAGHSSSDINATDGRLYINQNTQNNSLTIGELQEALSRAIHQGLQLAIFNSCDGLGLARDLAAANIPLPSMIVMREPVMDQVAQVFLKYFLRFFADGEPFHLAVRQAREQLKGLENKFPGASWLPVICQHPAVVPPTWPELSRNSSRIISFKTVFKFTVISVLGCIGCYLFVGSRIAPLVNDLGIKYHRGGQSFKAQAFYRLATLLDPNYAQPYYNLGWLCYESLDEVLDDTKCALALQSAAQRGLPEAYAELARFLILDEKHSIALKAIRQCLEGTQYDAVKAACLKNRAWVRWQQKNRLDEAEADLKNAIFLVHNSPHSHCLLAQVLEAKGRNKEALVAWKNTFKYSEYDVPEQDECMGWAKQRLQKKVNLP